MTQVTEEMVERAHIAYVDAMSSSGPGDELIQATADEGCVLCDDEWIRAALAAAVLNAARAGAQGDA